MADIQNPRLLYLKGALFLGLGIASWMMARRILRASRDRPDYSWAGGLARVMQVSFIGFAVGRTTWLDAVTKWRAHTIGREIAVARIARRFREWAVIFEHVSVH